MKKGRLINYVTVIAMLVLMALTTSVSFGTTTSVSDADIQWEISETGVLTISGEGSMPDYKFLSPAPWDAEKEKITSVIIDEGITSIGEYAFYSCPALNSATLPESIADIGKYAFFGCHDLKDITIPASVTGIGTYAFGECSKLTSIVIPNAVTILEELVFYECSNLSEVALPEGLIGIGRYAFKNCTGLAAITIPDQVQSVGYGAFSGCSGLTELALPDSITYIGDYAFEGCSGLTDITISNHVTNMGKALFKDCTELTSVILPEKMTDIPAYTFENCQKLIDIDIPENVSVIDDNAFQACSKLEMIKLPETLEHIGQAAFYQCTSLTAVTIPDNVTIIDDQAFYGCENLSDSIEIPKSVSNMGEEVFYGCKGIETIIFYGDRPDFGFGVLKGVDADCYYPSDRERWINYIEEKSDIFNWPEIAGFEGDLYDAGLEIDRTWTWVGYETPQVSVTNVAASGKPKLTWTKIDGASEYKVYRAVGKNGTYKHVFTTKSNSYTNTSAVAGKTYYYEVRAVFSGNARFDSASGMIKYKTCDLPRPVVTIKNRASDGKPRLTWTKNDGASKYMVYRSTNKNGTYKHVFTTTGNSYTNTSAVAGKTYYYKVKAICAATDYANSAYSVIKYRTCDLSRPVVSIKNRASDGKPRLTWTKIDGASKYKVYRAAGKNGTYKLTYTTTGNSYTNTSAVAGKTYYYKVKAVYAKNTYANSAYSTIKSIKPK